MDHDLDIQIIRKDGSSFWLSDIGVQVEKFSPPAPSFSRSYSPVGQYNVIASDPHVSERKIPLVFDVRTEDNPEQELQRLAMFDLFRGYEDFYVISSVAPFIRWPVHADDGFSFEPYGASPIITDDITVNLVVTNGFGETVQSTSNMASDMFLGMNIPVDCLPPYSFSNQSDMRVFVGGSIPLTADGRPAIITFNGNVDSQLSIANKTTGQTFQLNQALNKSQTLTLYGMVPVVDGNNVYDKSNHAYLDFAKGVNELSVSGASDFSLAFDTRYYV